MQEVLVNCWKIFALAKSKPKPETETAHSQLHSHSDTSLGQKFPCLTATVCASRKCLASENENETIRKPLENAASFSSAFTSDVGK